MTRGLLTSLGLILLWTVALPAAAWQSEVHTGLAQLNPALWAVPGVAGSYNGILMGQDLIGACHQRHSMRTLEEWGLRVYWDLVCGSTEPDAGKGFLNLRNPSHQRDRIQRSLDAFGAALGQFRQTGPERYARAARRLGHSLHYLQDAVDPTKLLLDQQDMLRSRIAYHVNGLLSYRAMYGVDHSELGSRLARWRMEVAALDTPAQVLEWTAGHQVTLAQAIRATLNGSPGNLDNLLLHTIAISVAGQERMVELYLRVVQEPTPDPWSEPVFEPFEPLEIPEYETEAYERPEYESEAAPRPPVGEPPR